MSQLLTRTREGDLCCRGAAGDSTNTCGIGKALAETLDTGGFQGHLRLVRRLHGSLTVPFSLSTSPRASAKLFVTVEKCTGAEDDQTEAAPRRALLSPRSLWEHSHPKARSRVLTAGSATLASLSLRSRGVPFAPVLCSRWLGWFQLVYPHGGGTTESLSPDRSR